MEPNNIPLFLAPIRSSSSSSVTENAAVPNPIITELSPPVVVPSTPSISPSVTSVTNTVSPAARQASISSSMFKGQASYASGVISPSISAAAGSTRLSPPSAISVTVTSSATSNQRSKQLAERLTRPVRTKEEIAAATKARHEASTKRRENFISSRKNQAASSAATAVASFTSSLEAAAEMKARLQQVNNNDVWGHLDQELPAKLQLQKKKTSISHHTGGVSVDFGHLIATPKATDDTLWSDKGTSHYSQQRIESNASSTTRRSPPQPALLQRLLERSPQRVSAVSRMVRNAASDPIIGLGLFPSNKAAAMPSTEDLNSTHDFLNSSTYSYASDGDNAIADNDELDMDDDINDDLDDDNDIEQQQNQQSTDPNLVSKGKHVSNSNSSVLTPEAISATLRSASVKRSEALELRRSAARAQVQAVTSRLTLLHQTQIREKAKKKVVAVHGPDAATLRRAERLLERAKRAIDDAERAAAVSQRVRAARRLQSWFRFRKILHLGEKEAEGDEHEARTAVIDELVRSEQQQEQQVQKVKESVQSSFTTSLSSKQQVVDVTGLSSSLQDIAESARAAVNTVLSPASKRSIEVLQRAICGQPILDNGISLEAARAAAAEEEIEAYKRAGRQPPPPTSPKELPAALPYGSFDDCALSIQQRGVLAGAQVCTTVIMRAYSMLEEYGATSSAISNSFQHDDKNNKNNKDSNLSLSAALRPSIAKSPRTLLAALLIAYFPNEILYTGFDDSTSVNGGSGSGNKKLSVSKQQRNDELVFAAKAMLAALHSFCSIVLNDAERPATKESAWWLSETLGATSRTIGARSLAYGLDGLAPDLGLDASAFVTPELRIALQDPQESRTTLSTISSSSSDPDRQARVIHSLLAFNQSWVKYMDAFMVWKLGDGMRISQTLALPFRRLALKRMELFYESNTRIGEGDAGLEQLREGVENQLAQLRAQLVSLLGVDGAIKWEKDQIASMEAERVREVKSTKAKEKHAKKENLGSSSSDSSNTLAPSTSASISSSLPVSTLPLPSSTSSTTPRRASASPSMPLFKQVLGNEVLAHELLLDPTFRLPEPATGEDLSFYDDEELDDDIDDITNGLQTLSGREHKKNGDVALVPIHSAASLDEHAVDIERALSSDSLELGSATISTNTALYSTTIHDRSSLSTPSPTTVPMPLGETISSFSEKVSAPTHSRSPVLQAAVTAAAAAAAATTSDSSASNSEKTVTENKSSTTQKVIGRRHTIRGKMQLSRVAQDPQLLRMSAAFWEASLRAAEEHATAEIKAEVSKRASAAILSGRPPPTSAPPLTQHHAIDLVCAALESVRDSIIGLLPHRPDIQSSISSKIDPELFKRMLLNRAFSHSDWLSFLRFVCTTIMSLEAPARQEDTKKWLAGAEAHVKRIAVKKAEQQAKQGRKNLESQEEEIKSKKTSSLDCKEESTSSSKTTSRTPIFGPAMPALVLASAAGAALDSFQSLSSSAISSSPLIEIKPILDSALLSLLPRVLAWAHFKISLIRLDTSNYHLMSLAPFLLQGGKGAEYERTRFDEKLAKGEARLSGTKLWFTLALDECVAVATSYTKELNLNSNSNTYSIETLRQAITRDSKLARLIILRDGILSSLIATCEHPITKVAEAAARNPEGGYVRVPSTDGPSGVSNVASSLSMSSSSLSSSFSSTKILPFPETLHLDAKRLQDIQNVIQRSALVLTLSAITQQIVSSAPIMPSGTIDLILSQDSRITTLSDLQMACVDWLKDESLRMQDLTSGFVSAADSISRKAGRAPFLPPFSTPEAEAQGDRLTKTLLSLISKAVSTNHPLYSAFSKRILENVRYQVTHLLQDTLPSQSANSDIDTSDGGSIELAIFWKRLAVSDVEILNQGVRTSISPHCKDDVANAVNALARLLRHNHAVYEQHYRGMQFDIRKIDSDEALIRAAETLRIEAEQATKEAANATAIGSADAPAVVLRAGEIVKSAVEAQRAASVLKLSRGNE
jgi:hypothetical protein